MHDHALARHSRGTAVAVVFARHAVDAAHQDLAVAQLAADPAVLHAQQLHAVDVDALGAALQQAALDFDAAAAAADLEAAVAQDAANGRERAHHEHGADEAQQEGQQHAQEEAGADCSRNHLGEDAALHLLLDVVGQGIREEVEREHRGAKARQAQDDGAEHRAHVGYARQQQLLVA